MLGALTLQKPSDLLGKLRYELGKLRADPYDVYAALNAARDAYHLCDWIWGASLHSDHALQQTIMAKIGNKADFLDWTRSACPGFDLIEELCNGSKHFGAPRDGALIIDCYEGGWGRQAWGQGVWGAPAALVAATAAKHLSVPNLLNDVLQFWEKFFAARNIP